MDNKHISVVPKEKGADIFQFISTEEYTQLTDILWKLFDNGVELNLIYEKSE